MTTTPYGIWKSPIDADLFTAKSIGIAEVAVDPITGVLYHSESRPSEKGRNAIVHTEEDTDAFDLEWNARTGVHEYGGAAFCVHGGKVYFSDIKTGRIHRIDGEGPVPVSPENKNWRYADFTIHKSHPELLIAVREDHTKPLPSEVVNTLVVVNTATQVVATLVSGVDFYSSPRFSPDGTKLAWIEWAHPDMPWEGSRLYAANISIQDGTYTLTDTKFVAGKPDAVSVVQPLWASDDTLVFLSDESIGYYNPWVYHPSASSPPFPILKSPLQEDFADMMWVLGMSRWTILDADTVLATSTRNGLSILLLITISTGETTELENPYATIFSTVQALSPTSAVFTAVKIDDAPELVRLTLSGDGRKRAEYTVLKKTSDLARSLPAGVLSKAEAHSLDGGNIHVLLSLPKNDGHKGPEGEKPPVIVNIHGGPTSRVFPGLSWLTQYFTSRGWAWLDVNYSGSSGYGREYRERLRGQWGIVDVNDSARTVSLLSHLVDEKRALIRGGSAGGYTVLQALTTPSTAKAFAGGTSSYGISDLEALIHDTHKFESHYMFKLIGAKTLGKEQDGELKRVCAERSPLKNAKNIKAPVLILQGSEDKVVPPNQAEAIVRTIREELHGKVEYVVFEGEGHGWRQSKNIKAALEKELRFYEEVLGLKD